MSQAFSRTLRSLASESVLAPRLALAGGVSLAVAWGLWMGFADVGVLAVSAEARLEVNGAPHAVVSVLEGRVSKSLLATGLPVREGDVLVVLDAALPEKRRLEAVARLEASAHELAAVERELAALDELLAFERRSSETAAAEAEARRRQADVDARFRDESSARLTTLSEKGALPIVDARRAAAEAESQRVSVEALAQAALRVQAQGLATVAQTRAKREALAREAARLRGEGARARAEIAVLDEEIARHVVRAPAAGQLAEAMPLSAGMLVRAGQPLGVVVQEATLVAVAQFAPAVALGRIAPGQPARLRLDGFPWSQWGTVSARVHRVAGEAREGRVRVELALAEDAHERVPLSHGLPGQVEIEVERQAPFVLALRAAGQRLARSQDAFAQRGPR
jgi:membrane fusion protein, adhesin transport system